MADKNNYSGLDNTEIDLQEEVESCVLPRLQKDIKVITGSIIDDTALAGTFVRVFCPDNEADYEEMFCSPGGNWIGIAPSCESELVICQERRSIQG